MSNAHSSNRNHPMELWNNELDLSGQFRCIFFCDRFANCRHYIYLPSQLTRLLCWKLHVTLNDVLHIHIYIYNNLNWKRVKPVAYWTRLRTHSHTHTHMYQNICSGIQSNAIFNATIRKTHASLSRCTLSLILAQNCTECGIKDTEHKISMPYRITRISSINIQNRSAITSISMDRDARASQTSK